MITPSATRRRSQRALFLKSGAPGDERIAREAHGLLDASVLRATFRPLLRRIRLGEGGLLGMTTWAAAWQSRDVVTTAVVFVLTALLLVSLYLYNDVSDRVIDSLNPSKVARDREPLLRHPRLFFFIAIALHVAVALAAARWLGAWAAAWVAALLVLNPLYSAVLKRVPFLDVVVVGTMGAALVGLATTAPSLLALAAAMTAISHGFQTRVDARPDLAAGIRSSGGAPPRVRAAIWTLLVAAYAAAVYVRLGTPWALSALVPYALLSGSGEPNQAWGRARIYFGIVWIAATVG